MKRTDRSSGCCLPKPGIDARPLVSGKQASDLVGLFKTLANGTRLRLLHALVMADELRVTDLAAAVGMRPQAVSNQLQRLADRGIVAARRAGNNVLYHITDPCIPVMLERGLCLLEDSAVRQRPAGIGSRRARPRKPAAG